MATATADTGKHIFKIAIPIPTEELQHLALDGDTLTLKFNSEVNAREALKQWQQQVDDVMKENQKQMRLIESLGKPKTAVAAMEQMQGETVEDGEEGEDEGQEGGSRRRRTSLRGGCAGG
jgi:hypothetical protein